MHNSDIPSHFYIGNISTIQDGVQFASSRQMPRQSSWIVTVPLLEPSLQYIGGDSQATRDQGHSDRRLIAISIRAALAQPS